MLHDVLEEQSPAGEGADGGGAVGAPGWPGSGVGLLLSTLEETLAALDWMLASGGARLAPPFCQVCTAHPLWRSPCMLSCHVE